MADSRIVFQALPLPAMIRLSDRQYSMHGKDRLPLQVRFTMGRDQGMRLLFSTTPILGIFFVYRALSYSRSSYHFL